MMHGLFRSFAVAGFAATLLTLASSSALAQTEPMKVAVVPATAPTRLGPLPKSSEVGGSYRRAMRARYVAPEDSTARAVVHLFQRRRLGGGLVMLLGGGGITSSVLLMSDPQVPGTDYKMATTSGAELAIALVGAGLMQLGGAKLARFSNDDLYALLSAYETGTPFSEALVKKLRRRDYRSISPAHPEAGATPSPTGTGGAGAPTEARPDTNPPADRR